MSLFNKLKDMTQEEIITWHLLKYGSIDQKQAIRLYGDYRLSDKILKLRRKDFAIESIRIPCKNRFGKKTEYVRYKIKKPMLETLTSK